MKRFSLLLLLGLVGLFSGCTRQQWQKSLAGPTLTLRYDDFGPEAYASKLLGPRQNGFRPISIVHGRSRVLPEEQRVNVFEAMHHLKAVARTLPPTPEGQQVRSRLSVTYSRLYNFYRTRRDAMLAAPFSTSTRGGMNRALMMPIMPISL